MEREALGSRLRMARELAGLSQAQAANLLSLHRPSVSEIEAGRRKVSAEELCRFAEIYDVRVSWLTGMDEGEEVQEDDRVRLAARELAKLKPADYERIIYLLKVLRSRGESEQ